MYTVDVRMVQLLMAVEEKLANYGRVLSVHFCLNTLENVWIHWMTLFITALKIKSKNMTEIIQENII